MQEVCEIAFYNYAKSIKYDWVNKYLKALYTAVLPNTILMRFLSIVWSCGGGRILWSCAVARLGKNIQETYDGIFGYWDKRWMICMVWPRTNHQPRSCITQFRAPVGLPNFCVCYWLYCAFKVLLNHFKSPMVTNSLEPKLPPLSHRTAVQWYKQEMIL